MQLKPTQMYSLTILAAEDLKLVKNDEVLRESHTFFQAFLSSNCII